MKITSVFCPKGGTGKTSLTINIADCLAIKHNKRVLVYDSDPQLTIYSSSLSDKSCFKFDVTDKFPESAPDVDFFIVDYRPTTNLNQNELTLLNRSDKLLIPVRPSRADIQSAAGVKNNYPNAINILNAFDKRIAAHRQIKNSLSGYQVISSLTAFSNTFNDYQTVFSKGVKVSDGIKRAKTEIEALTEVLLND